MTLSLTSLSHAPPAESRRWLGLVFIALGQLMVALDATIVNVALPTVQRSLGFADAQRHWVVTAYLLPFASSLLLGGRIADSFGRKRALLVGLAGFATASLLGGTAANLSTLMAARALQGLFGALLSPAALSLVAVGFPEPRARAKAFGVYGAVAACGGALGLVLGGWLMRVADWRWCLFVNVGFAAVAFAGASLTLVAPPRAERRQLDLLGALLVGLAVTAVVLGCAAAYAEGWDSTAVLSRLGLG
jgi:MFS family permease